MHLPLVGVSAAGAAGTTPRRHSPFAAAAPSITAAIGYLLVLLVWLVVGDRLPGGRWFAVHIFTLGVLTNLILTFSEHFARTVTRTAGERSGWWPLVTNAGALLVLVGIPSGLRLLTGVGASILVGVVTMAYVRLRGMRRSAVGARFAWIARVYERAHGAFIHGAVLGALLGLGLLPGTWYRGIRLAHLHANVLGWGGLTLLATLVFFGPTMARTRIESGADARAAHALRHGATGLSLALVLLILTGIGGTAATLLRAGAAAALLAYAVAATIVCVPVIRAVGRGRATPSRPLLLGGCAWLLLVVWADVAIVATGSWRWLDALGVAALTGALFQAVVATLLYLAPMLRGRTSNGQQAIRQRLEVGSRSRAIVLNLGVACWVLAAGRVVEDLPLFAVGLVLIAACMLAALLTALLRPT